MKKIMFNDKFGLTKAVLNGKKTMTRRIVSEKLLERWSDYEAFCNSVCTEGIITERQYYNEINFYLDNSKYKIGEVVAVAQSYKDAIVRFIPLGSFNYPAESTKAWNNKMFVQPDLMPHQIQITDIFIQKLHDISDEDCLKEGINEATRDFPWYWYEYNNKKFIFNEPRQAFASLIDKVYVNGTWEENLYVFGYEFKLIK